MKANQLKVLSVVGLSIGVFAVQTLTAADSAQYQNYRKTFLSTSALEFPATAASLVTKASDQEKATVTIDVVKAAVAANPASASAVVAEISRTTPDMAALAAGVASANMPVSAATIAKAAATAAPDKAAAIASSVSRQAPQYYGRVAVSVSQAVPSASRDILLASAEFAPSVVRADLLASTASFNNSIAVAGFLNSKTAYLAPAPVTGNPFSDPSGSYTTKNVVTDTIVPPPGDHGYSKP